ncbi:hypothetical protein BS78_01G440900 [Paspalum vaginatum]|nr:hypothetical protein BS78_01G440900 [Paspalum vaginatum]
MTPRRPRKEASQAARASDMMGRRGELLRRCAAAALLLLVLLSSCAPASVLSSSATAQAAPHRVGRRRRYDAIFSLGDSYADTGNGPVAFRCYNITANPVMRPPYGSGSTFFGRPTGRNCDGRLAIDFIAQSLGLPLVLLPPRRQLRRRGRHRPGRQLLPPLGSPRRQHVPAQHQPRRADAVGSSPRSAPPPPTTARRCSAGRSSSWARSGPTTTSSPWPPTRASVHEVRSLVPAVVATISTAVKRLITEHGDGAATVVVPGVMPMGCAPPVLVVFANPDPAAYDPGTGCLKAINGLAAHHNALLQDARFLRHRRGHDGHIARQIRVCRGRSHALLRRPREVPLQQAGVLRRPRRQQVQRSIGASVLGRRPPHRGGLPPHRRRLAERHKFAAGKCRWCWWNQQCRGATDDAAVESSPRAN